MIHVLKFNKKLERSPKIHYHGASFNKPNHQAMQVPMRGILMPHRLQN